MMAFSSKSKPMLLHALLEKADMLIQLPKELLPFMRIHNPDGCQCSSRSPWRNGIGIDVRGSAFTEVVNEYAVSGDIPSLHPKSLPQSAHQEIASSLAIFLASSACLAERRNSM